MVMPRQSSSALQSIRREFQSRKHKAALAPTRPACKKTSAPPLREGLRDKEFREPRPSPPRDEYPSSTISRSSGSATTRAPPPRRPRPSSAATATPAPPSRSVSSSVSGHMNPGTRVLVRTRSQMVIDGKILVLWLPAAVVSAADGGYEVIYEGKLPRDDPFSTVCVPLHHVRAFKPSPPTSLPLSQPPSVAAGLCASASSIQTAAPPKNQETQPAPRPTTAGKSMRLFRELASEKKPAPRPTTAGKSVRSISNSLAPRPTTAGKSISVVRRILPEMKRQSLDAYCLGY
ncbi:hypothetical protein EJB05_44194, partial [Eragrostis curvula]